MKTRSKTKMLPEIIAKRVHRGDVVRRVDRHEKGPYSAFETYEVSGATLVEADKDIDVNLEAVGFQVNVPGTAKNLHANVRPEDTLGLRAQLGAFRARHLGQPLPPDPPLPGGSPLDVLTRPLRQVLRLMARPELDQQFTEFLNNIVESRLAAKSESKEAQVILALGKAKGQINAGHVASAAITAILNLGQADPKLEIKSKTVVGILRDFGFQQGPPDGKTGGVTFWWDDHRLTRLRVEWGLERIPRPSVSSVPATSRPDTATTALTEANKAHRETGPKSSAPGLSEDRQTTDPNNLQPDQEAL